MFWPVFFLLLNGPKENKNANKIIAIDEIFPFCKYNVTSTLEKV